MSQLPIRPGFNRQWQVERGIPHVPACQVSAQDTLVSLSRDYVIYTDALVHILLSTSFDPYAQFTSETGESLDARELEFANPVFAGAQSLHTGSRFNHVLRLLPRGQAERWFAWVLTLKGFSARSGTLFIPRVQDLRIPDHLAMVGSALASPAAVVPIRAFAVESSRGSAYWRQRFHLYERPVVVFDSKLVFQDAVSLADRFVSGQSDVHGVSSYEPTKEELDAANRVLPALGRDDGDPGSVRVQQDRQGGGAVN
jgi:hypothetical protein